MPIRRMLFAMLLYACGARTGLDARNSAGDASTRDATDASRDVAADVPIDVSLDVPTPDCGEDVAVGEIRGQVDGISARVAIGSAGNLFTASRVDDVWFAVSLDPCLRERWRTRIPHGDRTPRRMHIAVDDRGDVWIVAENTLEQWRFSSEGEVLPSVPEMERRRDTWVGLVDGEGPIYSVFLSSDEKWLLRLDPAGGFEELDLPNPSSFVWADECAIFDGAAVCWSIAFDRAPFRQRWMVDRPRLLDGTFRNISPPATDGRLMWTVAYGISTYNLIAADLESGERVVTEPLMRTAAGQTELLIGPPVVAADGTIIVYRHGSGVPGALSAHAPDGTLRWTFPAARARRSSPAGGAIFDNEATHLVGGRDIVYLGMGDSVVAVGVAEGEQIWRLDGLVDLNESAVNLSPNGDLYVLDAEDTLYAISTDSPGLAASPWPIPGGNARLSLAR